MEMRVTKVTQSEVSMGGDKVATYREVTLESVAREFSAAKVYLAGYDGPRFDLGLGMEVEMVLLPALAMETQLMHIDEAIDIRLAYAIIAACPPPEEGENSDYALLEWVTNREVADSADLAAIEGVDSILAQKIIRHFKGSEEEAD